MRTILLTQDQVATVDDEDYGRLSEHRWCALRTKHGFYAVRNSPVPNSRLIYMHREVMGGSVAGYEVDHIDGDKLDNRKSNLRRATSAQNKMNWHRSRGNSRFRGVNWESRRDKWLSRICFDGKQKHLGYFTSEEDAARAYDASALEHFGEYARLNFTGGLNGTATAQG